MLVQRLANILAFERRCIRSGFVALVRRTLPVRLHYRALLARRIDALDASGYLRDATLEGKKPFPAICCFHGTKEECALRVATHPVKSSKTLRLLPCFCYRSFHSVGYIAGRGKSVALNTFV